MKKKKILGFSAISGFILLLCIKSYAQNDIINKTDFQGQKQGWWIIKNDVKKLPDYSNDATVEEGRYLDSKKMGIWKTYYPSGKIKSEITFKNNRPDGCAKMYYENGYLHEEGTWENNRWVEGYIEYYDNGCVKQEFNFSKSGKRQGTQRYYYKIPCGQLMLTGNSDNGNETGEWTEYDTLGNTIRKKEYQGGGFYSGQAVPEWRNTTTDSTKKYLSPNSRIRKVDTVFYKGGKKYHMIGSVRKPNSLREDNLSRFDGMEYVYNSDGFLEKISVYKDGIYVGDAPTEEEK